MTLGLSLAAAVLAVAVQPSKPPGRDRTQPSASPAPRQEPAGASATRSAVATGPNPTSSALASAAPQPSPLSTEACQGACASVLLIVAEPDDLNRSEHQLRARLDEHGYDVALVADDGLNLGRVAPHDLIIVSKTVTSTRLSALHDSPAGVLTWEDNLQMIGLLGMIDDDGSRGTAWHRTGTTVYVDPTAPHDLRVGLSGEVTIYREPDEITYGPNVGDAATTVATVERGDRRAAYYAYEVAAALPDGARAAGRRVYFPLYDDSFRKLTEDGLALFDAAVVWAAGR